ncbi:MAG: DUF1847 domain-containing protein [Clostridiales bacterium]|nr:DUF1847 domain-containing protein [Clostridiales bacterium]
MHREQIDGMKFAFHSDIFKYRKGVVNMLFCASCGVKNCAKRLGEEESFPQFCPSRREEIQEFLACYQDPETKRLAQASAVSSMDNRESRMEQTVNFARNAGFHKIGIAFCISLADYGKSAAAYLKREGFEVESILCKVGHHDRECIGIIDERKKPMCNPVAQAEYLNRSGTELNIIIGLCVGHDSLFMKYSHAPVTVLIAKDHRYHNAPAAFFDEGMKKAGEI